MQKSGKEDIFKTTIGSLHQDSNDNGVKIVHFATPKNVYVQSMMYLHRHIHKYTCIYPNGKTHNHIDHILVEMRWHSSILYVGSFKGADCDTDHSPLVANVREILAQIKEAAH